MELTSCGSHLVFCVGHKPIRGLRTPIRPYHILITSYTFAVLAGGLFKITHYPRKYPRFQFGVCEQI